MLQKFIKHIEAMQLPRCDDWWFYSYDFTRFGMVIDMCHCAKYVVESDDEFTMTVDEAFAVTEITCDMMTVAEFAALHHVQPVAVRQWIRRGKLRAIDIPVFAFLQRNARSWNLHCLRWRILRFASFMISEQVSRTGYVRK